LRPHRQHVARQCVHDAVRHSVAPNDGELDHPVEGDGPLEDSVDGVVA
jgi:hypothetical protein